MRGFETVILTNRNDSSRSVRMSNYNGVARGRLTIAAADTAG